MLHLPEKTLDYSRCCKMTDWRSLLGNQVLIWNVTNVGRQPVMLTNVGGEYSSTNNFVISTELPLPKMLQPGEYFTGWTDKHSELKKQEIKALTAIDSFGKIYKAPKKQVREIKEKLRKLKSNG